MNNLEVVNFKKRYLIAILVILIFLTPLLFVFINNFGREKNIIINKINNKETFSILVIKEENKYTNRIKEVLKDKNITYEIINTSTTRYYDTVLSKLDISRDDIVEPTIIYIENGIVSSLLVEINDEEVLESYIDNTYN